jgi:DNA modification methylase
VKINKIYNENCIDTMSRMSNNFIDLTVTSPPYDNLRTYKGYSFDFESIAKELYRVTKEGGVVMWNIGDATIEGSETGTSFRQALYFIECGFKLHDTMIFKKNSPPFPSINRYYQIFEYMFVFSKGKPKTTNLIKDRINKTAGQNNGMGKAYKKDGSKVYQGSSDITYNKGIRTNIWNYLVGFQNESTGHPAVFPEKLASDHIYSWSNENDLIYDCFMGSGTTAKAAHLQKRNWIGSEISKEYVDIANKRLEPYLLQTKLF